MVERAILPGDPTTYALLALSALVVVLMRWAQQDRDVPPGPKGHWLWGVSSPFPRAWLSYAEWAKEYGPVMSFKQGTQRIVMICGQQAAIDIMEKEGAKLVDRPRSIAAGETMSGDKRILLIGAGERQRKLRKALHGHLQPKIAASYRDTIQLRAAKTLVFDILSQPDEHLDHSKRYAASVIMSVTYGKQTPTSYSDPEVQEVNKCIGRLGKALRPGSYLVDSFPFIRFIPGYLSTLKQYHREELALFRGQLDAVRHQLDRHQAVPSFVKDLIEKQRTHELSDNEMAYLAGSMFGAGSDTTAAAISFAIMAAACYPGTQKVVQQQLDAVVGKERYPTYDDQNQLTEVQAYVLEVFRWRPVSAGGFAHRATQDIHWNGYRIPAGSTVIGNHWAISHDEEVYEDPDAFNPHRWMNPDRTVHDDPRSYNFGFGRRVCPGQHVANNSVFITTVMLLWAFDISADPSAPIDTLAVTETANVHPLPFKVLFKARIPGLEKVLADPIG